MTNLNTLPQDRKKKAKEWMEENDPTNIEFFSNMREAFGAVQIWYGVRNENASNKKSSS